MQLVLGVKRPGREADLSHPSSADVKNDEAISPLLHMSSRCRSYLIKRTIPSFYIIKRRYVLGCSAV
jgi:hypothetical protein